MITEAIIVALIAGLCSVFGQWLISRKNRKDDETRQAVKDALFAERLDRLEGKVDEHNGYAKRFEEVAVMLAEIKTELRGIRQ